MEYLVNFISVNDLEEERILSVGVTLNNDKKDYLREEMSFNIQMPYDRENTLAFIEEQSIAIAKDRVRKAAALLIQDDPSVA